MLVETHAHLDYPDFAADFNDVLGRANEAGVTRIITIGTSIESSRRAVDLAEKYPSIYAAIGVGTQRGSYPQLFTAPPVVLALL